VFFIYGRSATVPINKNTVKKRKIMPVGDSHLVSLPPQFMRQNGLKAGDSVYMVSDDILIIVVPQLPRELKEEGDAK